MQAGTCRREHVLSIVSQAIGTRLRTVLQA